MNKEKKKYMPYIRRANGKEKAGDLRNAVRLGFYASLGKPFYVMVQRMAGNDAVMIVGPSKHAIKEQILAVGAGWYSFKTWCTKMKPIVNKLYPKGYGSKK